MKNKKKIVRIAILSLAGIIIAYCLFCAGGLSLRMIQTHSGSPDYIFLPAVFGYTIIITALVCLILHLINWAWDTGVKE